MKATLPILILASTLLSLSGCGSRELVVYVPDGEGRKQKTFRWIPCNWEDCREIDQRAFDQMMAGAGPEAGIAILDEGIQKHADKPGTDMNDRRTHAGARIELAINKATLQSGLGDDEAACKTLEKAEGELQQFGISFASPRSRAEEIGCAFARSSK
jgi:hypothetical protein